MGYLYMIVFVAMMLWSMFVMVNKLDWNAWSEDKSHYTVELFLIPLFWPILILLEPARLFNYKLMFNKSKNVIGDFEKNYAKRLKELEQLAQSPPPCGKQLVLKYRHQFSDPTIPKTDIVIERSKLRDALNAEPHRVYGEEVSAIRNWIKNWDDDIGIPTPVPALFKLDGIVISLIEEGHGTVFCKECDKFYDASSIKLYRPKLHNGWNTETFSCPMEHKLIDYDWVHIQMRQDN